MSDVKYRIASGLELAFAKHGFAEPNIGTLRDAAGVSLRTLYKYVASREEMVKIALEHRHQRYINALFVDLPARSGDALGIMVERLGKWMANEAPNGCLFHGAVAAAPHDESLRALLAHHKSEIATRAAEAAGLPDLAADIMLIFEGLTHSWPVQGDAAVASAKRLCTLLTKAA